MIKKNLVALMVAFQLLLCLENGYAQNLLSGPQKIVIDTKRNRLLVSNFNTGDLIQIDSLGNQSYFVKGADFVDGMEIVGDIIYGVGSNRKIRAYDLNDKKLVLEYTIPGESNNYLSSIAYDSNGHLFISCPRLNEIYQMKISDHSYTIFAKDNGLMKPNGILLEKEKNRIVVIDDSPNSKIHAISLTDSTVTTLYSTSLNCPDGIVKDKHGNYFIGGYYLPGLYKVDSEFKQSPELFHTGNHFVYPTYDEKSHSLLITYYEDNKWERIGLDGK